MQGEEGGRVLLFGFQGGILNFGKEMGWVFGGEGMSGSQTVFLSKNVGKSATMLGYRTRRRVAGGC